MLFFCFLYIYTLTSFNGCFLEYFYWFYFSSPVVCCYSQTVYVFFLFVFSHNVKNVLCTYIYIYIQPRLKLYVWICKHYPHFSLQIARFKVSFTSSCEKFGQKGAFARLMLKELVSYIFTDMELFLSWNDNNRAIFFFSYLFYWFTYFCHCIVMFNYLLVICFLLVLILSVDLFLFFSVLFVCMCMFHPWAFDFVMQ